MKKVGIFLGGMALGAYMMFNSFVLNYALKSISKDKETEESDDE